MKKRTNWYIPEEEETQHPEVMALADEDNELHEQLDHVCTVERSIRHLLGIYKWTKQHNNSNKKNHTKTKLWGRVAKSRTWVFSNIHST